MQPGPPQPLLSPDARVAEIVQAGQLLAGKYRVERVLGFGGMGVVVCALDESLGRRVALKLLQPALASNHAMVERFLREARAVTQITGEHVAAVFEVGRLETGAPFVVMEYLQGKDLRELLEKVGAFRISDAVDYVLQAITAIAEAHAKGIVHRDLKPANLFLTRRADGSPLIKVLDFGIAKAFETHDGPSSALTQTQGSALGSPMYMSPEQIRSPQNVDARTDVWALGVVLHELLANQPPFIAETSAGLFASIVSDAPRSLRGQMPNLPPRLEQVVLDCLQKDPNKRIPNVVELATRLAPFGSDDARLALARVRGIGGQAAAPPPVGKRPTGVITVVAATLATLLVLGAVAGWWLWPNSPTRTTGDAPGPSVAATSNRDVPVTTAPSTAPPDPGAQRPTPTTRALPPSPSAGPTSELPSPEPPRRVLPPGSVAFKAQLGPSDHCNSRGARLEQAEQVLRQDRANVHRGRRDPADESDPVFAAPEARQRFEELLRSSPLRAADAALIVDNDALVEVVVEGPLSTATAATVTVIEAGSPISGCR